MTSEPKRSQVAAKQKVARDNGRRSPQFTLSAGGIHERTGESAPSVT